MDGRGARRNDESGTMEPASCQLLDDCYQQTRLGLWPELRAEGEIPRIGIWWTDGDRWRIWVGYLTKQGKVPTVPTGRRETLKAVGGGKGELLGRHSGDNSA